MRLCSTRPAGAGPAKLYPLQITIHDIPSVYRATSTHKQASLLATSVPSCVHAPSRSLSFALPTLGLQRPYGLCSSLLLALGPDDPRLGESGLSGRRTKSSLKQEGLTGTTPFSFALSLLNIFIIPLGLLPLFFIFGSFDSALRGRPFFLPGMVEAGGVVGVSSLLLVDMLYVMTVSSGYL